MESVQQIMRIILTDTVKNSLLYDDIDLFFEQTQVLRVNTSKWFLACLELAKKYSARGIHQELIYSINDDMLERIRAIPRWSDNIKYEDAVVPSS